MDEHSRPCAPGHRGLSLPASLRWVAALLLLVALSTATLVACSGDSGDATGQSSREDATADTPERTSEPTPDVQTQRGEELTVEEVEPTPTSALSLKPSVPSTPTTAATRELMPATDQTSVETDREALIAFYNATDGPNWTSNDNWLSDEPLGEWYGVATYPADSGEYRHIVGRVADLDLPNNGLSGAVPSELGQLSYLSLLILNGNELSGAIPAELGQLSYLNYLDLSANELSGEIPTELGLLSNLWWLLLNDNELTGEVTSILGRLHNLELLTLADNDLSGCIPSELSRLASQGDTHPLGLPFC